MRKLVVLALFLLINISFISASCNEGQIDVNTADKEKLQEINGIGPAYAEQIIALRPFESIDDLVRVSGIAEKSLENIKTNNPGLICVEESKDEENEEDKEYEDSEESKKIKENNPIEEVVKKEPKFVELDAQIIKRQKNTENHKNNYSVYGFVGFCVLLGFLFMLKKIRYNKNEFR